MRVIDKKKTGMKIWEMCDEKGITAIQLAEKLGIYHTNAIYCWWSGKNIPTVHHAVRLAEILGCTLDDIYVTKEVRTCS